MQEPFDVYLLDMSNYQFVSVTSPCIGQYSNKCIGSVKDKPDADSKFKLYLLSNGKVTLQTSYGEYLVHFYWNSDNINHIIPIKYATDSEKITQFEFEYEPKGGPFENLGTIALKADNGHYVAPPRLDGTTIKPVATEPHRFLLMPARGTAGKKVMLQRFRGWIN